MLSNKQFPAVHGPCYSSPDRSCLWKRKLLRFGQFYTVDGTKYHGKSRLIGHNQAKNGVDPFLLDYQHDPPK